MENQSENMNIVENVDKVEAAISNFRENQRRINEEKQRSNPSEQGKSGKKICTPLARAIGSIKVMESNIAKNAKTAMTSSNEKRDQAMDEFDQYVLYEEMRKRTEGLSEVIVRNEDLIQNDVQKIMNSEAVASTSSEIPVSEYSGDNACNDNLVGQPEDIETDLDKVLEIVEENIEGCSEDENDSEDDVVNPNEDYLFPTPEEVSNAKPPEVGMVFPTLEDAVKFVNLYGKVAGFAVIKGRNYKSRKITLECNKGRKNRTKDIIERKRKRNVLAKTNCHMHVRVKLVHTSWHIISVSLEHNHELASSPSLTKFFLSHRYMTEEEMLLSKLLQEIRVKPQRIMTIFRRLKGSFGNINFGKKKIDNLKQAERKLKRNTDIACALNYIEKIHLSKPGFCCKMQVDGEGMVRSLFWTDARSRMDYKLYGEIICFDTTYSTNKYNMPFAPIIGINGNARTIVFGWALLKDQSADTFEWLVESFVEVMDGKKPKLILTDQDAAIQAAVSRVFWDAFHRFCIWHILQNLKQNTSAYMSEREGMEDTIVSLIMDSLHVLEFETGWKKMLQTYNCGDHEHLKRMWGCRAMFVPAYFRGSFCPFTRSTGRSESFNSNFKDYVLRKDTIENFLKQYEIFQENVVEIESEDRFHSTQQDPTFWCHQPIERHAAKIYTRGIYSKFLTELLNSTAFGVHEIVKDRLYELKKLFNYKKPEYRRDVFTVCVDRENQTYECECAKFEKDGILCCHILRLFTQFDVVKIPTEYILPRWTIKFREDELLSQKKRSIDVHGAEASASTLRYAMLLNSVNDVCADLSRDANKSKQFIEEVHKIHKRLMAEVKGEQQTDGNSVILKDPPIIRKGSTQLKNPMKEGLLPEVSNVNIWLNGDGSVSEPVEQVSTKKNSAKKRKQLKEGEASGLKDPPVSNSVSVNKGNRLKPQSEKKSKKKKNSNK